MPSNIKLTETFKREAKKLSKKYKSLGRDIKLVVEKLEEDPYLGDRLSPNAYKIRFAIKSKGRGKSGGGRLITYVNIDIENRLDNGETSVYLIAVYDKSDIDSIPSTIVENRIKEVILFEEE